MAELDPIKVKYIIRQKELEQKYGRDSTGDEGVRAMDPKVVCRASRYRKDSGSRGARQAVDGHHRQDAHAGIRMLWTIPNRRRGNLEGAGPARDPYTSQCHTQDNEGRGDGRKTAKKAAQAQVGAI